jgi:hypothetical protein
MATASEIVTAIDTAILARINGTVVKKYEIGGRLLENFSMDELLEARAVYESLNNRGSDRKRLIKTRTAF